MVGLRFIPTSRYYDNDGAGDNSDMDVRTRGQLKVVAKTTPPWAKSA